METTSPKPPQAYRRQAKISDLMAVVAIAALVLGAARSFSAGTPIGGLVGLLATTTLLIGRDIFDSMRGIPCPHCGAPAMARVAVRPFGYHFYRCSRCQARRKRAWFGRWQDADTPRDESVFARRRAEGRWEPGPDLEFGPDPGATTHGRLLRGKWERRLADPHAPIRDLPEPEEPPAAPGVPSWGNLHASKHGASGPDWDLEL